jgi:hypothetical protein
MLGDRLVKSDSPLVSSKIDFADFLGLIVIPLCYLNSRLINKMK